MEKIQCKICKEQFKKQWLLKKHITQKHKETTVKQYIIDNEYNGIHPICKCGCGKELTYFPGKKGFGDYLVGHKSRIYNNWGNNKTAQINSAKTRRKRFKTGKIKVWNDGVRKGDGSDYGKIIETYSQKYTKENNPERAKKISKKLKGIPHSKEHTEKVRQSLKLAWTPEMREKQRIKIIKHLRERLFNNPTDIEIIMAEMLDSLGIRVEPQYALGGYLFDFWVVDTNILIETDGNFWHCKDGNPKYDAQKNKMRIDKAKNIWAQKNNYKLLRFWESDIKNNRIDVIQKLITEIKK